MVILHGENTVLSRTELGKIIDAAHKAEKTITRFEAKKLEAPQLSDELGAGSLFGDQRLIIIEELHSLPTSARKTQLIKIVGSFSDDSVEMVLWEKRQLTPTMLKQFPTAKTQEFKLTKYLFNWLDSIKSTGHNRAAFESAISQDGENMVFTFLIRQIRMLIQASEGEFGQMAPFMIGKLKTQAKTFSIKRLLQMHHKLLQLDIAQKTSTMKLSLQQELELLLIGM